MASVIPSLCSSYWCDYFFSYREEENRALPGAKSSGPRPSLSAQHQPHCEKQLHHHTNGGTRSSFIRTEFVISETFLFSTKSTSSLIWLLIKKHFVTLSRNQIINNNKFFFFFMATTVLIVLPNALINSTCPGDAALITSPFKTTCVQPVCKGWYKIVNTVKTCIITLCSLLKLFYLPFSYNNCNK